MAICRPSSRASRLAALVLVLGFVLGILSACGTVVPDVVGMPVERATGVLERSGLSLGHVDYDPDANGVSGEVIAQTPEAGSRLSDGEVVDVVVAGHEPVVVPDLADMTRDQVSAVLAAIGLASNIFDDCSETVADGMLISQSPEAGERVAYGSTVMVVMSKGPSLVSVPSVVGLTEADAAAKLNSAGLECSVSQEYSSSKEGVVISQTPASGSVDRGTSVQLVVSKGPAPSTSGSKGTGVTESHPTGGTITTSTDTSKVIWLNQGAFDYRYSFSGETDYSGWTYKTSIYLRNSATNEIVLVLVDNQQVSDSGLSGSGSNYAAYTGWYTFCVNTCYPGTVTISQ